MNTILGRKSISAGWKAKQLPPFRPIMELVLKITLPAHILDGYRMYCPMDDLATWVSKIENLSEVKRVARKIFDELCSSRRVYNLRRRPQRDIPLENIILFLRDALILGCLNAAIKRGDIGTVLNVMAHWMVMFRGTGKMPKYADAFFNTIMELKKMKSRLQYRDRCSLLAYECCSQSV